MGINIFSLINDKYRLLKYYSIDSKVYKYLYSELIKLKAKTGINISPYQDSKLESTEIGKLRLAIFNNLKDLIENYHTENSSLTDDPKEVIAKTILNKNIRLNPLYLIDELISSLASLLEGIDQTLKENGIIICYGTAELEEEDILILNFLKQKEGQKIQVSYLNEEFVKNINVDKILNRLEKNNCVYIKNDMIELTIKGKIIIK